MVPFKEIIEKFKKGELGIKKVKSSEYDFVIRLFYDALNRRMPSNDWIISNNKPYLYFDIESKKLILSETKNSSIKEWVWSDNIKSGKVYKFLIKKDMQIFSKTYNFFECNMLQHFLLLLDDDHLYQIIENFIEQENFDDAFYDFHKSMRITDFYDVIKGEGNGHIDGLFWNFISYSKITYKFLKFFIEGLKEDE